MAAKKTILLVDDDEDLREALAEQFELHDSFETLQAANANQGIDQATTQRIDLICWMSTCRTWTAARPARSCGKKACAPR